MRLLVVEDDLRLADVLRRSLNENGHVVDLVHTGPDGLNLAQSNVHDAVVLDVMLPGIDGFEIVRLLRNARVNTPILLLTALDATDDIVRGLDAGADDYVTKPFELAVLEARLRSIGRRNVANPGKLLCNYDVELDLADLRARRGGRDLQLSVRETAFLEYFLRNPERVLTRAMFAEALWDTDRDSGASNIIDVYVARLRAKLTVGDEAPLIHTVRSVGYRFGAPQIDLNR